MPYPFKKFRHNPFTTFPVIPVRRTDRQTDQSKNITSFFGEVKKKQTQAATGQWTYLRMKQYKTIAVTTTNADTTIPIAACPP